MTNLLSLLNESDIQVFLASVIALIIVVVILAKTPMMIKITIGSNGLEISIDSRSNH